MQCRRFSQCSMTNETSSPDRLTKLDEMYVKGE